MKYNIWKRCYMAVKTDMNKAYDRVEWDFIQAVLDRRGFHTTWINWIMQCVSTVSYSFLLNGTIKGTDVSTRRIRQGDPLSPYLFILWCEVLTGLCNKAQEDGSLPGIRVARNSPRLNYFWFADDTMFFSADQISNQTLLSSSMNQPQAKWSTLKNQQSPSLLKISLK